MKNILIIALIVLALIAMFGDGGLEVSPTLSPALEFSPALEVDTSITYVPTHIDTNIEQQTVIMPVTVAAPGGSSTVDPEYNRCEPLPGETMVQKPDAKGACIVVDESGNKFFINAAGVRWLLK